MHVGQSNLPATKSNRRAAGSGTLIAYKPPHHAREQSRVVTPGTRGAAVTADASMPATVPPERKSRSHISVPLPMTFARLTAEFLELACLLADTDPSDAQGIRAVEEILNGSAAAIQEKGASIAALAREFEARAAAAQTEADRIMAHARAARSRAAWLRDYLLRNLEALGIDRLETATTLLVVRQSPPAAEVLDEGQIPDTFKRVVQSIDKVQ